MSRAFAKAFYDKADGLVPSLPLGGTIKLGSIVQFSGGTWLHLGTITKKFGLKLPTIPPAQNTKGNSFAVTGGSKFTFKAYASGEPGKLITKVADAKARAEVVYGSEGAFMASVIGQKITRLGNLEELYHAIRVAYHLRDKLPPAARWQKEYAVVVAVAAAQSFVASIGSTKDAGLVISGKGRLGPPKSAAEVSAKMSFSFTKSETARIEAAPAQDYAFQSIRLDPSVYRRWDNEIVKTEGPGAMALRSLSGVVAPMSIRRSPQAMDLLVRFALMAPPGTVPVDAFKIADVRGNSGPALPRNILRARG